MVCEHLSELDRELAESGAKETFRGQAWSANCREWVYYDRILDIETIRERYRFPAIVRIHENTDERSGLERGFVCTVCNDGIMGQVHGAPAFP